jgi:hypothetical protein
VTKPLPSPPPVASARLSEQASAAESQQVSTAPPPGGVYWIGALLALLLAWLVVSWASVGPAARGERVLASLDPVVTAFRSAGEPLMQWLFRAKALIATVMTIAGALLAFVSFRRSALVGGAVLAALAAGSALAACGEVALLSDRVELGVPLFLSGLVFAALFGWLAPIGRLAFSQLPDLRSNASNPDPPAVALWRPWHPATDAAVVLALSVIGLLFRCWALNQLPNGFDDEMIGLMTGSATLYGFVQYVNTEFLGTGAGIFHFLTQRLCFELFGYSVLSVRLAAVLWGVAAFPLLYALVRRIAGPWPAVAATVLFLAAPEQLFWSRNENTHFAPVAAVTLATVHLALWLARRLSVPAAVSAALFMPFCRFSYTPSFILFAIPLGAFVHQQLFRRGALRQSLFVAPILLAGLALWTLGPSLLVFATHPRLGFRFIDPTHVHGAVAWRYGVEPDAGAFEVARAQAARITRHAVVVAKAATQRPTYSSHWYVRRSASTEHDTIFVPGLTVLAALGLATLLGQPGDARSGLLLVWVVAGLLPACMSDEPEARRLMVLFPALPVLAGIFGAAGVRAARQRLGAATANMTTFAFTLAVFFTALAGLTSHLALRAAPIRRDAEMRFARPLFAASDTVLHNLPFREGSVVAFGSLDRLLDPEAPVCMGFVAEKDWPGAMLFPQCTPTDTIYRMMLSPDEISARSRSARAGRFGYLLGDAPNQRSLVESFRALFPSARFRKLESSDSVERLVAIDVDARDIDELQRADLVTGGAADKQARSALLSDARLISQPSEGPLPAGASAVVRGGLLVPEDGWWRFAVEPPCSGAALTVDNTVGASGSPAPLLAGVHPFELTLRSADCPDPLRIAAFSAGRELGRPGTTVRVVSPRVAALAGLRAPSFATFSGYGTAARVAEFAGAPVGLGADATGTVHLLLFKDGQWELHSYRDGGENAVAYPELPRDPGAAAMAVGEDGTSVVTAAGRVETWRSGVRRSAFSIAAHAVGSDVTIVGREVLFAVPERGMIERYTVDGTLIGTWAQSELGRKFFPEGFKGLAANWRGDLMVLGSQGDAVVLRVDSGGGQPRLLSSFRVAYGDVAFAEDVRNAAFDGDDRILFPHHGRRSPLAYALTGERLMAEKAERDLGEKGIGSVVFAAARPEALFVVTRGANAIFRVERR